jgi:hypothetical protein
MGTTYAALLDALDKAKCADTRSDPEYQEHLFEEVIFILQSTLEKLRDQFEQ